MREIAREQDVNMTSIRVKNLSIRLDENDNFERIKNSLIQFEYRIEFQGEEEVINPVKTVHRVIKYEPDALTISYNPFYVDPNAIDCVIHPLIYKKYRLPVDKLIDSIVKCINHNYIEVPNEFEFDFYDIQEQIEKYEHILNNEANFTKEEVDNAINNLIKLNSKNSKFHDHDNPKNNDSDADGDISNVDDG